MSGESAKDTSPAPLHGAVELYNPYGCGGGRFCGLFLEKIRREIFSINEAREFPSTKRGFCCFVNEIDLALYHSALRTALG